jgi:hypothetical protein
MATWKKVVVSGSSANLAALQVDNLTAGNVVIGGGSSDLTTTPINGTGNIVATTAASGLSHSGSFSGSFQGFFSGITDLPDLTQGAGITTFLYDGAAPATVSVSGASTLNVNKISKWTGAAFADTSLTDNGTLVTGATSIQLTGANSSLTGSFTGSFTGTHVGNGKDLLFLTASYLGTSAVTNNTNNYILTATGAGNINGESNLTFDGSTLALTGNQTISSNLTVSGDLTVNGTATFINTQELLVKDKFITIASGSTTLTDAGIIAQYNVAGSGSAFYLEAASAGTYGRWAVAYDVLSTATVAAANEFVNTTKFGTQISPAAESYTVPTWGGVTNGRGNMYLGTDDSIWIYA